MKDEKELKNIFFNKAKHTAKKTLSSNDRVRDLVVNVGEKLKNINFEKVKNNQLAEKLFTLMRMVKAHVSGQYSMSLKRMLTIVAALVYFVMPIDMIPDFIPLTGYIDDLSVILWVFRTMDEEIAHFKLWEDTATPEKI